MSQYGPFLQKAIEDEKAGIGYCYSEEDREILDEMFEEINYFGKKLHYIAELDSFNVAGAGTIMAKYIRRFPSEAVRAYLIPQIVSDRILDGDKLILDLYLHFKDSDAYFSPPGKGSPVHIYVRYDNAFRMLKPKRLKNELIKLAYNPHDVHRLPFTMTMLASWKLPEMRELLIFYSKSENVTQKSVGVLGDDNTTIPLDLTTTYFEHIRRELQFTAINGLRYYPSKETYDTIVSFLDSSDEDICAAARKTLKSLERKNTQSI